MFLPTSEISWPGYHFPWLIATGSPLNESLTKYNLFFLFKITIWSNCNHDNAQTLWTHRPYGYYILYIYSREDQLDLTNRRAWSGIVIADFPYWISDQFAAETIGFLFAVSFTPILHYIEHVVETIGSICIS